MEISGSIWKLCLQYLEKLPGDNSYYLDNNGVIAVNQWIDDTYYVDDDGVMAKNFLDPVIRRYFPRRKQAGITWTPKGKLIKDK